MKSKWWWGLLPLVAILLLFAYNFFEHGNMVHPGKPVYEARCANCHGLQGEGIRELIPPLANADFAKANFSKIPCYMAGGLDDTIIVNGKPFSQTMYPVLMGDVEMSNVINYINNEFELGQPEVSASWVMQQLENCQ